VTPCLPLILHQEEGGEFKGDHSQQQQHQQQLLLLLQLRLGTFTNCPPPSAAAPPPLERAVLCISWPRFPPPEVKEKLWIVVALRFAWLIRFLLVAGSSSSSSSCGDEQTK